MNDCAQTKLKSPNDNDDDSSLSHTDEIHQHQRVICLDGDDVVDNNISIKSDADDARHQQPPTVLKHRQRLRGGSGVDDRGEGDKKRNRSKNVGDFAITDTIDEQLSNFKASSHSLRISASSVAALCGLHPYQNVPQLLFDLVYQSYHGQLLLQNDAKALGLILVDAKTHEQETMLSLASSVSKETKELIQQVLEVSEGKRTLHSVDEVQTIQQQIKVQAMEAQQSGKLTQQQVESLVESSRGHVSTGFGTCHEEEALDVYEKRVGARVRDRNETLMEWQFERRLVDGGDSEIRVTASPLGRARRRRRRRRGSWADCTSAEQGTTDNGDNSTLGDVAIDDGDDTEIEIIDVDNGNGAKSIDVVNDRTKPFFRIVGAVDGIRDELYSSMAPPGREDAVSVDNGVDQNSRRCNTGEILHSDNEDDQWSIRPIVVECKHRMKNAIVPPPIYDQIQTSLYCHMYDVEDADLIQVVRRTSKPKRAEDNDGKKSKTKHPKEHDNGDHNIDITVTRISLNDPIYQHRHHWETTLLPRLASFVDAVYSIRKDDGKRYRLLMALIRSQQLGTCNADGDEEAWNVLWDECRWMRDCDTAFEQKRRWIQSKRVSESIYDRR